MSVPAVEHISPSCPFAAALALIDADVALSAEFAVSMVIEFRALTAK
ncbi:MAG: hypothetical protein ACYCST_00065 [Acidimicrobiales bacterium]